MENLLKGPVLIENLPDLQEHDGIAFISRDGECKAAMRMEVFEAYMFAGMELVTNWRNRRQRTGRVVPIK